VLDSRQDQRSLSTTSNPSLAPIQWVQGPVSPWVKRSGRETDHSSLSSAEGLKKQDVLGGSNPLLSLIRHGPHSKRHVQQFFNCCVCIRYRGNVSTEPLPSNDRGIILQNEQLPSNDRGIPIQTHRLMGGIIYLGRWDGLRCRDIRTKVHKYWFRHSKADMGGDARTSGEQRDFISLLYFFQNKESGIKRVELSCHSSARVQGYLDLCLWADIIKFCFEFCVK
jgi:hypothetical protein